jgi:Rrf2 family protein
MLNDTAEYALRAVLLIAGRRNGTRVTSSEVAGELDLPPNYLSKTLRRLAKRGVLESTRGPGGGYTLTEPPDRIPLARVVEPFQKLGERKQCLMGREDCDDRTPCAAHHRWRALTERVESFFRETTVADLLEDGGPRREIPG